MKLAEALVTRKDLNERIAHLKTRIHENLIVQEGERPSEDPGMLIQQLDQAQIDLTALVVAINKTNTLTAFEGYSSLGAALAERDRLLAMRDAYASMARAATVRQERYSQSEIKSTSVLSATDLQKKADDAARDFRLLDLKIQATNWAADLLD